MRQTSGLQVPHFERASSTRPRWMRGLNAIGRALPMVARADAEAWIRLARQKQPDAPELPAPIGEAARVLCEALRSESALNLIGRISARDDTVRMIRTQLRIQKTLAATPAIRETELPDPIFIIGWPRTGSTFLHTLLANDPATRTIPYWESFDPVPAASGEDLRPAKVDKMLEQLASIAPDYQAIHPMTAEMTEECVALFMNELRTLQFDFQYAVPSYVEWLLAQDARIAYRAYREQLQLIQHHRPHGTRFLLKDPTHLVHLETVIELFPTARFIFTHRDPRIAISSICSLYAYTRAIFSDRVDPLAIGREVMDGYWPSALDRAQELRASLSAERVADVRQVDLARDPLASAEAVYRKLGLDFGEAARAAMSRFVAEEESKPATAHAHSLEGFGLEAEAVRERFSAYCDRFDL